jgi:hypothetical protein
MTVVARPDSSFNAESPRTAEQSSTAGSPQRALFATWLVIFAVFAVAFELACRVEDWVLYRTPILSPYHSVEDLLTRDAEGMHGRANARFQKWVMNELGTRGPSAQVVPPPGTIRVVTVGASETFGLRESPDHEFPRQLEDSLNALVTAAKCAGAPRLPFEVLNAAFAGMTMPTIEQDVRMRLVRLKPSIIVAYLPSSAYLEEYRPVAAAPDTVHRKANRRKLSSMLRLRATDRVRDQVKGLIPERVTAALRRLQTVSVVNAHDASWRFNRPPPDRLAAFDVDLRRLIATIRSIGATPVLVTHGDVFMGRATIDQDKLSEWEKFYPRATGQTLIAFDSLVRLTVLRVASDSGVVAVDAARALAAGPDSAFADPTHFTDLGATVVARELAGPVALINPAVRACLTR